MAEAEEKNQQTEKATFSGNPQSAIRIRLIVWVVISGELLPTLFWLMMKAVSFISTNV